MDKDGQWNFDRMWTKTFPSQVIIIIFLFCIDKCALLVFRDGASFRRAGLRTHSLLQNPQRVQLHALSRSKINSKTCYRMK